VLEEDIEKLKAEAWWTALAKVSSPKTFFLKVTGRGENPPPEFHSFNIVADHELQKKLLTRRSKYFSNTGENEGEETQHDAG